MNNLTYKIKINPIDIDIKMKSDGYKNDTYLLYIFMNDIIC